MARFKSVAEYSDKDRARQDTINNRRSHKKRNEKDKLTDGKTKKRKQVNTESLDVQSLKQIKSMNDALLLFVE